MFLAFLFLNVVGRAAGKIVLPLSVAQVGDNFVKFVAAN
jgi:hypothetical protein